MTSRKADALEELLADERAMILSGRFDDLAKVTQRKLDALAELPELTLPAARLKALAVQVTRNQGLLDASIRGMKAARIRIESVVSAAGSLSTYDSSGQKADLGRTQGKLQKKA